MAESRIDAALIERVRERIGVDWRRTGEGDWQRMPRDLRRKHPGFQGGGLVGLMLNAVVNYDPGEVEALKPIEPLAARAVEKIEKGLGFKLPAQLRQLYVEIGDGGFGPFNGIRRLSNWAKDYAKLRADLKTERGRDWPEALLPIVYLNGRRICVDRDSGAVILWTRPPKKVSEKKWLSSFVPQSPSVAEWLERWVDTPTVLEDGPEGGWQPPAAEVERRQQVEADKEAKRDAEEAKARSVSPAVLPPLPKELVERIRARALDPDRRTYLAGAAKDSAPYGLAEIEDQLVNSASELPKEAFVGLAGILSGLKKLAPLAGSVPSFNMAMGAGGGMVMMKAGAGGRLGAPATDTAIAHAETKLGFALPEPIRQLYRIADGGFGPGDGLLSLATMIGRYRKLTSRPQGPGGELWPARLLPIWEADEEIGCLDLESGAVSSYNPSRMADIHGGYWRRSFAKDAESLADLFEGWLGEETVAEQMAPGSKFLRDHMLPPEEDPAEIAIAYFAERTPQERADAGLPETGWEEELRRRHSFR